MCIQCCTFNMYLIYNGLKWILRHIFSVDFDPLLNHPPNPYSGLDTEKQNSPLLCSYPFSNEFSIGSVYIYNKKILQKANIIELYNHFKSMV